MRFARGLLLLPLIAACNGDDDDPMLATCERPSWHEAVRDAGRSLLSVWGRASDDVWIVGGGLGSGSRAALLHWDGEAMSDEPIETDRSLWWIWGTPDGDELWMVGEAGTVLRRRGGRVETIESPVSTTLFGAWGTGTDDVWIVGGEPGPENPDKDVLLHWDGEALRRVELPAPRGTALLKIWGSAADDVWVSGEGGTLWHMGPDGWTDRSAEVATVATLNSVHGCGRDEVYVVGGQEIFRFDGTSWAPVAEAKALLVGSTVGVSCGEDAVIIVGLAGLKLWLDKATGEWHDDTLSAAWDADFHAAWVSPDGEMWTVGGNYTTPASSVDERSGLVAYRGCADPRL
jgi:hypothetical protein